MSESQGDNISNSGLEQSVFKFLSNLGLVAQGVGLSVIGEDPIFPIPYKIGEGGAFSIAAAGVAAAQIWRLTAGIEQRVSVSVDAAAAALRCDRYLLINGSPAPSIHREPGGSIYKTADGRWIYLHRSLAHHRAATARVLGVHDDIDSVRTAVGKRAAFELEEEICSAGACAAVIRSSEEWARHPQSIAVSDLPLLEVLKIGESPPRLPESGSRPLSNVKVLDLTRILAGPTCTRTLAEHGADVLRISHPRLADDDVGLMETGRGKRNAILDLKIGAELAHLNSLLATADVFCQGYRPGSLADLGLSVEELADRNPGIVYVTLSAFGHVGPWRNRRGFDTILQSVSGIVATSSSADRPHHLPVSALDYMTGYLMAAGAMVALARRAKEGGSYLVRASLAQTCQWLQRLGMLSDEQWRCAQNDISSDRIAGLRQETQSKFGLLGHLAPVAQLSSTPGFWSRAPEPPGSSHASWLK